MALWTGTVPSLLFSRLTSHEILGRQNFCLNHHDPERTSSRHQWMDGHPAGGGGDDSFYSTLDLGHEAQINNDLVRAIRKEIVDIESAINVASTNVCKEERSFAQLTTNNKYSRGKMFDYRRDAAEMSS